MSIRIDPTLRLRRVNRSIETTVALVAVLRRRGLAGLAEARERQLPLLRRERDRLLAQIEANRQADLIAAAGQLADAEGVDVIPYTGDCDQRRYFEVFDREVGGGIPLDVALQAPALEGR